LPLTVPTSHEVSRLYRTLAARKLLGARDMPVIIRRVVDDRFKNYMELAADSWDLRTQIEALEEWLTANANDLNPSDQWVADVGFTVRLDALGGGPPISRTLMEMCVASNLEIYLSEYGAESDS
jgi:hypothetical protein